MKLFKQRGIIKESLIFIRICPFLALWFSKYNSLEELDQQQHLATCEECKFLAPIKDLLN